MMNKSQTLVFGTLSGPRGVGIGQSKPREPGCRAAVHLAGQSPQAPLTGLGSWFLAFVSGPDLGLQFCLE